MENMGIRNKGAEEGNIGKEGEIVRERCEGIKCPVGRE
jgi:hypothetical protein